MAAFGSAYPIGAGAVAQPGLAHGGRIGGFAGGAAAAPVGGLTSGHFGGYAGGMPAGYAGGAGADCCGAPCGPGYAGGGGALDCCAATCGPGAAACLQGCASCGCGGVGCGSCGTAGFTYAVVGQGHGDYVTTTTYKYVGAGAGSVALVPIPAPGCSCWWLLLGLLPLFLLPFLLPDATTTTTTTSMPIITTMVPPELPPLPTTKPQPESSTTTPAPTFPPQGPQRDCFVYGDPHVTTFDKSHPSFYSQGEYWMVKSDTVWIQGRYLPTPVTNGLSVTKEIAIGGPFLQSKDGKQNVLRISALSATWNGVPIIPGFPDHWKNEDPVVEVNTDSSGQLLQSGRGGKELHVVHVKLPLYISLQINRWNEPGEGDYINTRIVMSKQPNQDGHCGNFNGDPGDDTRPQIRARVGTTGVDQGPQFLFGHKTPVTAPNRPDLNNCPTEKSEHARKVCEAKSQNGIASKECMIDVCFGGDQFAEHDADSYD